MGDLNTCDGLLQAIYLGSRGLTLTAVWSGLYGRDGDCGSGGHLAVANDKRLAVLWFHRVLPKVMMMRLKR
ncbi:MAG: hypothetical protein AAF546_12410 [Verrucomicrobiota bacterium]